MRKKTALGLMSGTSADGLSIAAASFRGKRFELLAFETRVYPPRLRERVLNGSCLAAPRLAELDTELGVFFAQTTLRFLRRNRIRLQNLSVIGSHGQTVLHSPRGKYPFTLQIGDPNIIAAETGLPVVSDFRRLDIASGGEGAPLIPFFDKFFFGSGPARALLNVGGIANVTIVGKNVRTAAFDTGPGNMLMDLSAARITRGRTSFDRDGRLARRGKIDFMAVRRMCRHPYFRIPPPKSTGRELFNAGFLEKYFGTGGLQKPFDRMATLTFFTAASIFQGISRFSPVTPTEIIVSGGGVKNPALMRHLCDLFRPLPVRSIEEFGIPAQAKEPLAFAFFALRRLERKQNHLPETTGARRACLLGQLIVPRPR